jgi:putative Mg2+ transporter-C (MgtC) family protein
MNLDLEISLRLLLATVLGGVIGFQREWTGKEAGLRTNILICVGSALFTALSLYAFPGSEPARIAAQIATGVGFIGAGVILHRDGGSVKGLTSAATIWAVAGIGMAAGAGMYIVSAVSCAITTGVLMLPHLKKVFKHLNNNKDNQ